MAGNYPAGVSDSHPHFSDDEGAQCRDCGDVLDFDAPEGEECRCDPTGRPAELRAVALHLTTDLPVGPFLQDVNF